MRFYVMEVSDDNDFVRLIPVTQEFTASTDINKGIAYYRSATADTAVYGSPGPRFYGKLDMLLTRLEKAPPVEPELVPVLDSGLQTEKTGRAECHVPESVSNGPLPRP